jgi:hemerythrin superfamily protein
LSAPTEGLRQDHRRIRDLLRDYFAIPLDDRNRRDWLFDKIHREILLHFTLEEEVLYPTVQKTGVERALDSIEEARWGHRLLRQLLTELSQMDSAGEAFDSKVSMLRTNLENNIEAEERTLFPEVRDMSREMRESLRSRLERVKERLLDSEQHG